ncbi:MAG: metallophosphoesterase [Novosphingobium sp.]|nr:metallophosphoesterase [Novosphingobium sp.]
MKLLKPPAELRIVSRIGQTPMIVALIIVVLVLLAGLFFYTPWRLGNLLGVRRKWWLFAGVAVIIVVGASSTRLASKYDSAIIDLAYLTLTAMTGFLLYLFLGLILAELLLRFTGLAKRRAALMALLLAATISAYGVWNAYQFEVDDLEVKIEGLERPVTLAVLADLQLGGHRGRSWLEQTVAATNKAKPDVVLLPGDLIDGRSALNRETLAPLADLNAPAYFVTGNHDLEVGAKDLKGIIRKLGVIVLENDVVQLGGNLQLVGLEFMNPDEDTFELHPSASSTTIKSVLPTLPIAPDVPSILMHHSPVGRAYASQASIDLMVSGHTHGGGQVFPAPLIACRLVYTYCDGLNRFDAVQIYVSQGLGTFTLPMRVGTQNELGILRLVGR